MVNGEPYFVGKDVTEILGFVNASKALADHVDEMTNSITIRYRV